MTEPLAEEQPAQAKRPKGIFLLPNLLTTAALFAGFFSILSSVNGSFDTAVLAIFAAMVLDGLDGRIARLTNTQSAFGAEYDSLSDMVAFGLAPSLLIYLWALKGLGKLGWVAAFVYTAGAALRLARFNTQVATADKRWFQGLPSPAAAALITAGVWMGVDRGIDPEPYAWLALVLTLMAGLLMVSNIRYNSFKELGPRDRIPFVALVSIMLGFAVFVLHPPTILSLAFVVYTFSGPVMTLLRLRERRAARRQELDSRHNP